jgi:hypothetical protein
MPVVRGECPWRYLRYSSHLPRWLEAEESVRGPDRTQSQERLVGTYQRPTSSSIQMLPVVLSIVRAACVGEMLESDV